MRSSLLCFLVNGRGGEAYQIGIELFKNALLKVLAADHRGPKALKTGLEHALTAAAERVPQRVAAVAAKGEAGELGNRRETGSQLGLRRRP